ncbi:MAG: response regulator transcription factor [Bacteroidetes bacterium]|nr:response regulator transcription factor [Bacteroidota bacterium]
MAIGVCIVEDDREIRELLSDLVLASGQFDFLGGFETAEDLMRAFRKLQPDVVLMDLQLPGRSGIECIRELKLKRPETQFLVCTVFEDNERVYEALLAGATGYMLKSSDGNSLIEAISSVHRGESPMTGVIARKVIENFTKRKPSVDYAEKLTEREREIVEYLSRGFRYKEIASQLGLSTETVRTHIRNVYEKLQVGTRTEAINKIYGNK